MSTEHDGDDALKKIPRRRDFTWTQYHDDIAVSMADAMSLTRGVTELFELLIEEEFSSPRISKPVSDIVAMMRRAKQQENALIKKIRKKK